MTKNEFYIALGKTMRQKRRMMEITQSDLADQIGIHCSEICAYEKGNRKMKTYRLYEIEKIIGPIWPKEKS